MKPLAFAIIGPTASGKSSAALALAKHLPVELISVDSAQVYRGMDIGTAKPTPAERAACPQHLIDLISPEERYSAARFRIDALAAMDDIQGRGRIPLLVGGTMLYFKVLREGLSELPAADLELRRTLDERAARQGWPALHAELASRDPQTAARLEPNDAQRIQRALEVVTITGRPMVESFGRSDRHECRWRIVTIALLPSDRSRLHQAIAARFDAMLAAGLLDELRALRTQYHLSADLPSMRCVGYRQAWEVLEGLAPPDELRDRGIVATRQLAKRQLTWLRGMGDMVCIDSLATDRDDRVARAICENLEARP